jgi:hypothetical protein
MSSVDAYIANIDPSLRALAEDVRLITKTAVPDASESLKMGIPTFSLDGVNVAAIADYNHHINLYFFSGAKLTSKLLEGTGRSMRHIRIRTPSDIRQVEFVRLLKEAARLARDSQTQPGPTKPYVRRAFVD